MLSITETASASHPLPLAARSPQAAPPLRGEVELFWLFDHLALRAGLAGRVTDSALLAGYADAACRTFEHMREPVGRHAMEHLSLLLRDALPDGDVAERSRLGEQLSEDQAIALVLSA